MRAAQFMLVYFSKENSWTICKNDKGLFKEKNEKIMVHYPEKNKWVQGKIKMIGTEEECRENGEGRYENGGFFSSDSEARKAENSPDRAVISKSKNTARKMDIENKKFKDLSEFYNSEEEISSNQSTKPLRDTTNSSITIVPKYSGSYSKSGKPFTTQDWLGNSEFDQTLHEPIDKSKVELLIESLLNKVDLLSTELMATKADVAYCKEVLKKFSTKKGYDKEWPTVLKYKEYNILDIPAEKKSKYIRGVMGVLFTTEELGNGIVHDESNNKKSKSTKKPLDSSRIKLLREAYEIKYRVRDDQKSENWKKVIELANSFCRDTTKELKKNHKKQQNDSLLSNTSCQSSSTSKNSKTSSKKSCNHSRDNSISSEASSNSTSSSASAKQSKKSRKYKK
jgi:hypothetical protein